MLKKSSGAVLLFVLAAALAMSTMVLLFQNKSRLYVEVFSNSSRALRINYAAEAGISIGRELIKLQREKELSSFAADRSWPREKTYEFEGLTLNIKVDDENSKINPNKIFGEEKGEIVSLQDSLYKGFFSAMGYSATLRDSLLDWMDEDDIPRQNGAEAFYYRTAGLPYVPPNKPLYGIEEISLVRDFTEDVLFGEEKEDGEMEKGLIDFITLFSDGKINVNTCTPEIFSAMGFTAADIEKILASRKGKPLAEGSLISINREAYIRNRNTISFKSNFYSVYSEVSGAIGEDKKIRAYIYSDDKKTEILRWSVI